MIFIATNKRDITVDFIVLELKKRNIPYFRLNTEDINECEFSISSDNIESAKIELNGKKCDFLNIKSAYYRRPAPPKNSSDDRNISEYINTEWSALLRYFWNILEKKWLNSPFTILKAEDKPYQLLLANEIGFNIPKTLISNSPDAVKIFADDKIIIGKPIRRGLIEDNDTGRVIFTSKIDKLEDNDFSSIRIAPVIFQEQIIKSYDIRATVVDNEVFAAAIMSQSNIETSVDWRKGAHADLKHEIIELPENIQDLCVKLTKKLGLRYSAIDLVKSTDGKYWFLEINPNGQWAWIEQRTKLKITNALVDALTK